MTSQANLRTSYTASFHWQVSQKSDCLEIPNSHKFKRKHYAILYVRFVKTGHTAIFEHLINLCVEKSTSINRFYALFNNSMYMYMFKGKLMCFRGCSWRSGASRGLARACLNENKSWIHMSYCIKFLTFCLFCLSVFFSVDVKLF